MRKPGMMYGRVGLGLGMASRAKDGRGRLSLRPRPALQAAASICLRYSSRIHAFTVLTVSGAESTARR